MPKIKKMKRIFYFNITYGCNSNCIFCYSHNTHHNGKTYNEISAENLFNYLDKYNITEHDRIIINGGEPFLHEEIKTILVGLTKYPCEILIYTNGRLIGKYDVSNLPSNYRFIIPIHGYESIHDRITREKGSYRETIEGMRHLVEYSRASVDIKIIINELMLREDYNGVQLFESLKNVKYNNAVHITKMADTIVSRNNNCNSISDDAAEYYTLLLFKYFKQQQKKIKIFDTCIKGIARNESIKAFRYCEPITVFFKDKNQFRVMDLKRDLKDCMKNCAYKQFCRSAVDEYLTLEYYNGQFIENLE